MGYMGSALRLNCLLKRCLSSTRKRPIDPEQASKIPVFEYPVSKQKYSRVFVFGSVLSGALGVPFRRRGALHLVKQYYLNPKRLGFAEKFEVNNVASGFGFTLFSVNSDTNVKVYGTGTNTDSQIGCHQIRAGKPLEVVFFPQPIPLPFKDPKKAKVKKVAAGRAHSAVLTNEGLFLLGNNAYGQCGRPVIPDEDYIRSNYINHIKTLDGKTITDVELGQDHTLAVTEDGCVYSCGWGADGQTGLEHCGSVSKFTRVRGDIDGERIAKLSSRSDFVLALNDKGDVFGWGNVEYAQVTLPKESQQLSYPTHLKMLQKLGPIKDVGAGGSLCVVISKTHEVYSWGFGILGTGPEVQTSKEPIHIPHTLFGRNDFQPNNFAEAVNCGLSHCAVRTSLGDVYIWGRNKSGCLGLGHLKDQFFPLKVSVGGYARHVTCGFDHTVVLCKPYI